MATIAPSAFSTSTSSLRASQSQHAAPYSYSDSALTQLPSVEVPFDDLRRRMADFTSKFDAFIEKGRKRVLEERNEFKARLSELNDQNHSTKTQISSLQSSLGTQSHIVQRETAEKNEMHVQISELESHHQSQMMQREKLRNAISATQRQIDNKIEKQREYALKMDGQSRLNGPELSFWETYLGCRIEGAGDGEDEGKVRIVYVFPPARSGGGGEREASLELKVPDSGSGGYEVVGVRPRLKGEDVERVVGKLNETREISTLLKGMRALFGEEMK